MTKVITIFGPPGTGKTTYLMREVERLILEGIDRSRIAYTSFTKAATREVLDRMGLKSSENVSTLHALVFRLCGLSRSQVVTPELLEQFAAIIGMPVRQVSNDQGDQSLELGDELLSLYQLAQARGEAPDAIYQSSHRPATLPTFQHFYQHYERWKHSNGLFDYNDFLLHYLKAPVPLVADVLFVDEAQDLSRLQWRVIQQMAIGLDAVYLGGDDDQAIYEWAGADPHGITAFGLSMGVQDRHQLVLGKSWRLPKAIFHVARSIAQTISTRVSKDFVPRDDEGLVQRHGFINTVSVANGVSTLLLYRNHSARREVESWLIENRIPFVCDSGKPGPLQTRIARGVRTFEKLKAGAEITEHEHNSLVGILRNELKHRMANTKDWTPLLSYQWQDVLWMPYHLQDYYQHVDMNAPCSLHLGSIHAAKGREADHVIVYTGMTARTIESMMANPDAEARVWYVAVTRARQKLDIVEGFNGYEIP